MKNLWKNGNHSFEEIRSNSFAFANGAFELVKLLENENKGFDAIELMNHAPKILRVLDSIKHESDQRKFKSGIQLAISELQASKLELMSIYRITCYKMEVDDLLSKGRNLQDILTSLK